MSDEERHSCKKAVKKFLFISGGVFVGATLAILVSAALLKPKCPPPPAGFMPPAPPMERQLPPPPAGFMPPAPPMERQLPPPPPQAMGGGQPAPEFRGSNAPCPCQNKGKAHKHHREHFNPQAQNMQLPPAPPARPEGK